MDNRIQHIARELTKGIDVKLYCIYGEKSRATRFVAPQKNSIAISLDRKGIDVIFYIDPTWHTLQMIEVNDMEVMNMVIGNSFCGIQFRRFYMAQHKNIRNASMLILFDKDDNSINENIPRPATLTSQYIVEMMNRIVVNTMLYFAKRLPEQTYRILKDGMNRFQIFDIGDMIFENTGHFSINLGCNSIGYSNIPERGEIIGAGISCAGTYAKIDEIRVTNGWSPSLHIDGHLILE